MNCYFCHHKLSELSPHTETYSCKNCLTNLLEVLDHTVWNYKYSVVLSKTKYIEYLYLQTMKLWLLIVHKFDVEQPYLIIRDNSMGFMMKINKEINIFDYDSCMLENKVKTWITFS